MTGFGMRVARYCILEEIKNDSPKNLVISPLSLHIALNMVASSSTGRTLEQFLCSLESESVTDLNAQSSLFMELASSGDGGPTISLANGIWLHHRFPVKPSFKRLSEDVYKAKAESVDFANQGNQVTDEINSWAREATKGYIDPLLPPDFFIQAEIALLASAIYFNGTWVQKFLANDTEDEYFHLPNGRKTKVPFMKTSYKRHLYGSFEGFKLLKMEYKNGKSGNKKYAMYIFLPDQKDGLQELIEKFSSDPRFLSENHKVQQVLLEELWLPKLKYENDLDLSNPMKKLGLDLPFDAKKAEITEMVEISEVVYISNILQKSYIEVNEEGTIATAVTWKLLGVGASLYPRPPPPPLPSFIADHPFLFTIKEELSDIILFVGVALNPEKGEGKKRKVATKEVGRKKGKDLKEKRKKSLISLMT